MIKFIFTVILLSISIELLPKSRPESFSFSKPKNTGRLQKVNLWATLYFVHQFRSSGKIPITDVNGNATGLFADTCNFCEARLEGTARIKNPKGKFIIINFAGTSEASFTDCRTCEKYSQSKLEVETWGRSLWSISKDFGDGINNYKLVPFRTIAVDKNFIPYGSVLYIPKARGKKIRLSDGKKVKHDGYFFAGDTGTAIKGNHIDFFTGISKDNPFSDIIRSNEKEMFHGHFISEKKIVDALTGLHIR